MSSRALIEALLKVWGVLSIVDAVMVLTNIPMYLSMEPAPGPFTALYTIGQSAAGVLIGFALIGLAPQISRRLVSERAGSPGIDSPAPALVEAAFGVLGLYFVVEGLAEAAPLLYSFAQNQAFEAGLTDRTAWFMSQAVPKVVVSIAAGAFLLLKRRWIVSRLRF